MTTTDPIARPADNDRIEERVHVAAARSRVWRALTDPAELGAWFGMRIAGATIAPGVRVRGAFTIPGHEHETFDAIVEEVVPETRFAWRWPHGADEPGSGRSPEVWTLVAFRLEDAPDGGTFVTVVESGFDALPDAPRRKALADNTGGWREQLGRRLPAFLAAA